MNPLKSAPINVIAAVDSEWGISRGGKIPWDIKEDTNYFRDLTKCVYDFGKGKKNAVIMGKYTWLNLGNERGLEGRINIVVSSTLPELSGGEDVHLVNSLQKAVDLCYNLNVAQIFICGGSMIYKEAFETLKINSMYLTHIDKDYKCDNIFPMGSIMEDVKQTHHNSFTITDHSDNTSVEVIFGKYSVCEKIFCTEKNVEEDEYLNLLSSIVNFGHLDKTRNGYTYSLFAKHLSFDLSRGFPLLTTKKVFFKGIVEELLFFLRGDTNTNHLVEKGVNIWRGNTSREFLDSVGLSHYEEGDQGPMYGFQLLHNGAEYKGMNENYEGKGFNQLEYCIDLLKRDPYSRRIMMTTYNPSVAKQGCLYPCHGISILFNVHASVDNIGNPIYVLSCMMTQRSADMFLGIPFNIASYALLVHVICETVNNADDYKGYTYVPGTLTMALGNVHVYESHKTACIRQILRNPYPFPQLKIKKKIKFPTDFEFEDLELENYRHHPIISAKMVA